MWIWYSFVVWFFFILSKAFRWRQEYYSDLIFLFRTGFPSNLWPQPGHCFDPHSWCSSSFASMRSELLTQLKFLILFMPASFVMDVIWWWCYLSLSNSTRPSIGFLLLWNTPPPSISLFYITKSRFRSQQKLSWKIKRTNWMACYNHITDLKEKIRTVNI